MRIFILIAGLVLASATAQAADRSLSLAGTEMLSVTASTKIAEAPKAAEAPQAVEAPPAEAPKYIERPAVVEPKAETPKAETPKVESPKVEQPVTEPARPVRRAKPERPRRTRYWSEARIINELHRHGIYW